MLEVSGRLSVRHSLFLQRARGRLGVLRHDAVRRSGTRGQDIETGVHSGRKQFSVIGNWRVQGFAPAYSVRDQVIISALEASGFATCSDGGLKFLLQVQALLGDR